MFFKKKSMVEQTDSVAPENQKKPRKTRLFLKTFLITTCVMAVVLLAGLFFLSSWISPPDIPEQTVNGDGYYVDGIWYPYSAFPEIEADVRDTVIGELIPPDGYSKDDRKPDFYTFIIVGLDNGYQTDTIMVASYDGVNKEANIISIPRDTLVNVHRNVKKINAAYGAGTLNGGGHEGGIDQLKREVSTLIGFVPDFYVCVGLKAFERLIDAVGGIDIYNPYNMVYDDPEQNLHINISSGNQHLKGSEAIKFARYRQNNYGNNISDFQRIENQHAVINATLAQLLRPASLLKIPEFIDIFTENVRTDLELGNVAWITAQMTGISGTDALTTYTMPMTDNGGRINGIYYLFLAEPETIDLVNRTINPYVFDIPYENFDIINSIP